MTKKSRGWSDQCTCSRAGPGRQGRWARGRAGGGHKGRAKSNRQKYLSPARRHGPSRWGRTTDRVMCKRVMGAERPQMAMGRRGRGRPGGDAGAQCVFPVLAAAPRRMRSDERAGFAIRGRAAAHRRRAITVAAVHVLRTSSGGARPRHVRIPCALALCAHDVPCLYTRSARLRTPCCALGVPVCVCALCCWGQLARSARVCACPVWHLRSALVCCVLVLCVLVLCTIPRCGRVELACLV